MGLVAIAAFYGFLQLGGFKTQLIACALLFGCLSLVIKQVAWGRFERSFLPEFNDFSIADDIIGPAVLGLATTIVTFGPFIMLVPGHVVRLDWVLLLSCGGLAASTDESGKSL